MKRKTSKQKKPIRLRRVWFSLSILILFTFGILFAVNLLERIVIYESEVIRRFDRLYGSVEAAEEHTNELTQCYDGFYYERLSLLDYMCRTENGDYSQFVPFGSRYFNQNDVLLYNRSGTLLGSNAAAIDENKVEKILENAYESTDYGVLGDSQERFYYLRLTDDLVGIIHTSTEDFDAFLDNNYTPNEVIGLSLGGGDNFFFSAEDGVIQAYPEGRHVGERVEDVITQQAQLTSLTSSNSIFSVALIDEKPMLTVSRHLDSLNLDLYYAVSFSQQIAISMRITVPVMIVFGCFLILYVLYFYFLRYDYENRMEHTAENRSVIRYKMLAFVAIALVSVAGMAYYARTIHGLSNFIENYQSAFDTVRYVLKDSQLCISDLQKDFDKEALNKAQAVSRFLSDHPEHRTKEKLDAMSSILNYDCIILFDTDGNETLCSADYVGYSISSDPDSPSYIFNPLKNGIPYVIGKLTEDDLTFEPHQIIGVTTKDASGHVDGFLQTVFYPRSLLSAKDHASLVSTFDKSVVSTVFDSFVVNADTGEVIYAPIHEYIGQTAVQTGFEAEDLRADFSGYRKIMKLDYFLASAKAEKEYIFVGMEVDLIFFFRLGFTFITLILFLLCLIRLYFPAKRLLLPEAPDPEPEPGVNGPGAVYVVVKEQNRAPMTLKGHILQLKDEWPTLSAEEKMGKIIGDGLLVLTTVFSILLVLREDRHNSSSILSYIIGGNWPRGINVFSVSATLILIIVAFVGVTVIRGLLNLLSRILTARAETLCHLIRSFVEYGAAIAVAYFAFSFLGMDVRSLMASVGFLTLIIGFGTKSLITDIVAGLFIIFEQEFKVGDIIEVGGYRGMVTEIGMRTTKIVSWDKNVKIINNRDISNVINMTMRTSFATVNFTIPVTTSIDDLETILREELGALAKKYPDIIGVPYFAGVLSFNGSKMECRISAEVNELARADVEACLHREVQEILKRHNIEMK